jgi:hypothetical protein
MWPAARQESAAVWQARKQRGRRHARKTMRSSAREGEGRPSAREKESGLRRTRKSAAFGTRGQMVASGLLEKNAAVGTREPMRTSTREEPYGIPHAKKKCGHRHARN